MRLPRCLFIFAGLLLTTYAHAEVYKCTFVEGATRQNKVVYSDAPCAKSDKQTLITIPLKSQLASQTPEASQATPRMQAAAIDAAVTRAVLSRDFKLAKSLATTKEHWRLIAIAEGGAAPQPLIVANSQSAVSREEECAEAKYNFESVSRTSWRDKDLVAAKKSVMYVACGVPEPVPSQPLFVGRAYGGFGGYGGLYSGRWYPRNHASTYQIRSGNATGYHAHPPTSRNYFGHNYSGSSSSFSYKSKHFGINVDSVNGR